MGKLQGMNSNIIFYKGDQSLKWQKLDVYIKQYQDPKQVDKLEKLKS